MTLEKHNKKQQGKFVKLNSTDQSDGC